MKTYIIHVMEARGKQYKGDWRLLANNIRARSSREALRLGAPITKTYYGQQPELTRPRPGLTIYEYAKARYAVEQTA